MFNLNIRRKERSNLLENIYFCCICWVELLMNIFVEKIKKKMFTLLTIFFELFLFNFLFNLDFSDFRSGGAR